MKPTTFLSLSLSSVALALSCSQANAKPEFVPLIPNGANVPDVQAVGHSDHTGQSSALDAFGKAFKSAGKKWTTSLCQADSDGDGQTNGQELGDPCCEWSKGQTPRYSDGVSDPGTKSKTADPALWANINCSASSTTTPSSTLAAGSPHISFASIGVLFSGLAAAVLAYFAFH